MTIIKYTPEQHDVLDHMQEKDGILLVAAGAGSGKSFIAKQVAEILQPKKALYTAFNKAIVQEGIERFKGLNVECKTFHALAYKYVKPTTDIEDLTYTCIKENISYAKKYAIINSINQFFVSASVDMHEFFEDFFEEEKNKDQYIELCTKYIDLMIDGQVNPTFNFLLKYFHLLLVEGDIKCEYDLVILDEINDTTAVALEIFKLITAPKKLGLGETHQAIYQFLNLVDGFELLSDAPLLKLTQSFRCSEEIAAGIQKLMREDVTPDFTFIGTSEPVANGKTLFVTRTNAYIIAEIHSMLSLGKRFKLLRNPSDIFACPLALLSASKGKKPYQKKYKFLLDEYENYCEQPKSTQTYFDYLTDHIDDEEIINAIRLLMNFKKQGVNLYDLYKRAKEVKPDDKYTIATVFTSKGLEYENVFIADDLNRTVQMVKDNGGVQTEDDIVTYRCYYVACSRAGLHLHNATHLK